MAGIYIHIPFCTAKCAYCDFYSVARPDLADAFIDAVGEEYSVRKNELGNHQVNTLYIGGGTPSLLSPRQFKKLISFIDIGSVDEFTVEANPDDITDDKVEAWTDAGVNRVSIGVQSLIDRELKAIGRRHDANGALAAIATLRRKGINNISGDLIYGLPLQTLESFKTSLERLLDSGIKHLSAYCLSYEEGTLLYRRLKQGLLEPADDNLIADMYETLCHLTRIAGFEHYEISNFALPRFKSRHNSSYWCAIPYLGLGPGAHSLDTNGVRRYVPSDIRAYINRPNTAAVVDEETETDRANDRIMISLRTADGIDLSQFNNQERLRLSTLAKSHIKTGNLVVTQQGFAIPEEKFMISDAIIRDLFL